LASGSLNREPDANPAAINEFRYSLKPTLVVTDPQLFRDCRQRRVSRPQFEANHECRRQKMYVDPSDASAVQLAVADEGGDIRVRDNGSLIHAPVLGQQRLAPAFVANEELAVNEIVASHFVATQEVGGVDNSRSAIVQHFALHRMGQRDHGPSRSRSRNELVAPMWEAGVEVRLKADGP